MIASTLLLLSLVLPQEPTTGNAEPPASAEADSWWQQLDPEQRERLHRRWSEFRGLDSQQRETLRRRHEAIEEERSLMWRRLGDQERSQFERWNDHERRRWLDERVRDRLRERVRDFERREPDLGERLRQMPPDDRIRQAERHFRERHLEKARADLEKAAQEGWIGPAAAEWLRQADPHEVFQAVGQVERWRFLQRADREGLWERRGIGPELRSHLLELPPPFFFEEMKRLEHGGEPLGPGRDWRHPGPPRGEGGRPHGGDDARPGSDGPPR